jgi:thiol-disulfide isomerase/thioredoxin
VANVVPDRIGGQTVADPLPASRHLNAVLEYVSSSGCSDCLAFERLLDHVRPDYPDVEVRAVAADSTRGIDLSIGRGILRFPIIAFDDVVVAVESITEADLRAVLGHDRAEAD